MPIRAPSHGSRIKSGMTCCELYSAAIAWSEPSRRDSSASATAAISRQMPAKPGPGERSSRVEIDRAVDLDLEGVDAALRAAVAADDVAAGIRRVARGAVAQRLRGARPPRRADRARSSCRGGRRRPRWRWRVAAGLRPRRHRMAIEQDRRRRSGRAPASSAASSAAMIGPVDLARSGGPARRAGCARARSAPAPVIREGIEAEAAAGARRLDEARRRQRRRDQRGIDLALVAVEVDLGARRPGDEGGGAGGGGAPDQPVDQPVLERLEHRLRQPRRLEQLRADSRARHGAPRGRPARPAARGRSGRRAA